MDRGSGNFYVIGVENQHVARVNLALNENLKATPHLVHPGVITCCSVELVICLSATKYIAIACLELIPLH